MSSPFPLDVESGVIRALSSHSLKGRWIDCDHIRFRNGKPQKINGWTKLAPDVLDGLARGSLGWTAVAGFDIFSTGTFRRVYAVTDQATAITPLRTSGTLTDPFTTIDTETTVTVVDMAHGLDDGAIAIFDNASAVGGITIDGAYVVTVIDADSYTIEHSSPATSSAGPGGGSVDFDYEINPGFPEGTAGLGWGSGAWGVGTWGTPRDASDALELEMRFWSFATRGDGLLYFLPSGGTVYSWDEPASAARGVAVTNAPTMARYMFITPEGIIVMLGTTTPMTMQWNDRDVVTVWTPAEGNTANERRLKSGNKLVAGATFSAISLVWTDTSLYLMQFFDSSTIIYDTRLIAEGCGLMAPGAFAITPRLAIWLGTNNCHIFAGVGVEQAPRFEEMRDALFNLASPYRIDLDNADKTNCGFNHKGNEFWIHYVSPASPDGEPDRYVKCNLDNWDWDLGTLTRTTMSYHKSANGDVIMVGTDMIVYRHEDGTDADGLPLEWFIKSSIIALSEGQFDMDVQGFIPDFEYQAEAITVTFEMYERPQSERFGDILETEAFVIEEGDIIVDTRLGGRYANFMLSGDALGGNFRLGTPIVELGQAGDSR